MSLLAQQRAKLLAKLAAEAKESKNIVDAATAPTTVPSPTSKPSTTTSGSLLGKARSSLLNKPVAGTKPANPTALASKGAAGDSVVLDSALLKAKTLMQTAEEQLATDKASGLFDLKEVVNPEIPAQKFMETFQQLRFAQLAKTPDLPQLQVLTMNNLRNYEELAHILTDEQIAVVVSGALEVANVKMATGKSKPNATKTVAAKAGTLNLSDFG